MSTYEIGVSPAFFYQMEQRYELSGYGMLDGEANSSLATQTWVSKNKIEGKRKKILRIIWNGK